MRSPHCRKAIRALRWAAKGMDRLRPMQCPHPHKAPRSHGSLAGVQLPSRVRAPDSCPTLQPSARPPLHPPAMQCLKVGLTCHWVAGCGRHHRLHGVPVQEALAAAAAACAAGPLHPCCCPHSPAQVASAVTRACQLPRSSTTAQRAAQLQSVARVSGAASLRRQQGAGMGAATRLSAVRAMATANGPVTKKVRRVLLECVAVHGESTTRPSIAWRMESATGACGSQHWPA